MTRGEQHVVKLRTRTQTWISPSMTPDDAAALTDGLRVEVERIGDEPEFVDFECRGDRRVAVRAREVVTVEQSAWVDPVAQPHAAAAPRAVTPAPVGVGPVAADVSGTEFLRQRAGVDTRRGR